MEFTNIESTVSEFLQSQPAILQPLLSQPDDEKDYASFRENQADANLPMSNESNQVYKTETYRWLILAVVTIAQMSGNMIFVSLQPISIPIARAYNLHSVMYVNVAVIVQSLNCIPMTLLCVWMYSKYSTAGVLRFAMSLLLLGSLFRSLCIKTENFWPVFVG